MKLGLLWVGRTRDRNMRALLDGYIERIGRYVPIEVIEVKEESAADRHAEAGALMKEGRRIREKIPQGRRVVLLDLSGRAMTSEEFAGFLGRNMNASSHGDLLFIIGGHQGVDEQTKQIADHTISLSRMTLTHEMARLIAAEQIYRALSILRGARYHR